MFNIFKDIRFLLIYVASLSQAISNTILLIFISKKILDITSSIFLSSSVFSAMWVLSIISSNIVAKVSNSSDGTNILIVNSALNLLLTAGMFYVKFNELYVLYIIISLRGLSEALNRNVSITSIKRYINPKLHHQCFSFFNNAKTLGAFLGGVLLLYIPNHTDSFPQILNINLVNCVVALLLYIAFKLYKFSPNNPSALKLSYSLFKCFQDIVKDKIQLSNLFHILLSNVFFLGYYQVSRIFIPSKFDVDNYNNIALFQIAANIAVVLGTLYATTRSKNDIFILLGVITNCIIISAINYININFLALLIYFTFIFIYQSIYSISLSNLLHNTNESKIGYVITFINTFTTLLMIIFISISSICVDLIGYTHTSILISVTCLLILALLRGSIFIVIARQRSCRDNPF